MGTSVLLAYKHHLLCPIRPTTMPHSHPSSNSPLKMPKLRTSKGPPKTSKRPQRAGVDDGAFFKAARRTGLATSAFSWERELKNKNHLRRNASSSSKYYQDLLRLLQTNLLCEELTP